MQIRASSAFLTIVAATALVAVACGGGPSQGPTTQPQPGTGTGSGTGSGDGTGTGGNGSGGGGSGGGGGGTTTPPGNADGGTTAKTLGCNGYVQCLLAATTDAAATACDSMAKDTGAAKLDAVDTCVGNFCLGMNGGTARCKADANGDPVNLDGSAPFDMTTGDPSGDCGACLTNGEAALWGDTCQPTNDPACNTSACTAAVSACKADM
jgi:hypothetical protein